MSKVANFLFRHRTCALVVAALVDIALVSAVVYCVIAH